MSTDKWDDHAVCKTMDGEIFFPHPNDHCAQIRYVVCGSCPVTEECLESALTSPRCPFGVWGGRTEAEVQRMWRARRSEARRLRRELLVAP